MATLQTHFRGRGGLIQNLAIEAEFLHHFFLCFSSFWPKSFRREKPDFLAARLLREKKLVRRRSFLFLASLVHTLSTTITIYHKLNVRTSRFFFFAQFNTQPTPHEPLFSATFCPKVSRNPFNFTVPPSYRGYCVEFFPVGIPSAKFHLEEDPHHSLFTWLAPRMRLLAGNAVQRNRARTTVRISLNWLNWPGRRRVDYYEATRADERWIPHS